VYGSEAVKVQRRPGDRKGLNADAGPRPRIGVAFEDLSGSAQLREIALWLFAEHGIGATSIRMVAAAAGVSPSAVLHYFPSKKALEAAVQEEVARRVFDAVHAISPTRPPREAVQERYGALSALLQTQPYLAEYLRRVLAEGGEASVELFKMFIDAMKREVSARIEAGNAREFDDPDVGLALFWLLSSAEFLIAPQLEAVGLDLTNPEDIERLHRAQTDLLTRPLFSAPEPR
jgi:AcrR family transcriptional regulator